MEKWQPPIRPLSDIRRSESSGSKAYFVFLIEWSVVGSKAYFVVLTTV
jgi:hypothetical protein